MDVETSMVSIFFRGGKQRQMNQELLRIIENVARDKNIDKESIFADLEESMVSAVREAFRNP